MSDRDNHGMNCAHRSDSDEPCTCACRHHAAVDTERTMHAAWRKRAEEAERENADLRARLEAAEKAVRKLAEYGGSAHGIGGPFKCWDLRRMIDAAIRRAVRKKRERCDAEWKKYIARRFGGEP